ncbi:MAG: glycosyltransferase, partial [Anaerolineales bacterium]|nr:glycosyltransferase [Anaerolineales bacterium]
MKIAIVAPTYLPALRANTIQVMKMAQAMVVLGHEVRVAVPGAPQVTWDEISRHYGLREEINIEWLPVRNGLRRYDYGIAGLKWAKAWRADLLYTRLPQAAAFGSWSGLPTVFEVHDLPQSTTGKLLLRGFLKGNGARKIVAISKSLARDLGDEFS